MGRRRGPLWVAFVSELGARLHADGRILTVTVPPIYDAGQSPDSGYWVYDYGGIARTSTPSASWPTTSRPTSRARSPPSTG